MSTSDLLLYISAEDRRYRVELKPTTGGEILAQGLVDPPDQSRWEALYLDPLRQLEIPRGRLASLGKELARLALPEPVRKVFLDYLQNDALAPLRLRLCVVPSELAFLPWEYLYLDPDPGFLSLDSRLSFFRQPTVVPQQGGLPAAIPLRILLATADPGTSEWPRLTNLESELRLVQGALRTLETANQVSVKVVEHLTPEGLQEALQEPFQIFHFCGHARLDPSKGSILILENASGTGSHRISCLPAAALAKALCSNSVQLAILSACETPCQACAMGRIGVAQALTQAGLPAVVAVQAPLPDATAPVFMREVYSEMALGQPLDQAVQAGRLILRTTCPDWGLPVLFLSVEDPDLLVATESAPPSSASPPTGTVTLMFTDIQDSSELWKRMKRDFVSVLQRHNNLLRREIHRWQGYEVKTLGDSFMVAFAKATNAVRCAIEIQRALDREKWPPEVGKLLVRIGIHTGEPLPGYDTGGRYDYLGPMVNRTARVAETAQGGQILLSQATHEIVHESLPQDIRLVNLGSHRLRGLERSETLFEVVSSDLPSRPLRPSITPAATPVDLSQIQGAPFFLGRQAETKKLARLLRPGSVVRLEGEGGIGKTALAVEVARRKANQFPGGVFGLSLDPLPTYERLVQMLGRWLLGDRFGNTPEEDRETAVVKALQDRPALLLVDNYETLVEAMPTSPDAQTLGRFLGKCVGGQTALLLTGREPSGLPGEQTIPLAGLTPKAASKLFRLHATQREVDSEDDLKELLAALDYHPLAIELVARDYDQGWESLAELRARLATHLPGGANLYHQDRHATLKACFDASFNSLPEILASFFLDLGLFAGPFTASAAAAVTGLPNAKGALINLCQRSLVRRLPDDDFPALERYQLLSVVRLYVQDRAARENRDQAAQRERFVRHYAEQAHWLFNQFGKQPEAAIWAQQFWPNLIQATEWATGPEAANLSYHLGWLAHELGKLNTAATLYKQVLTVPGLPSSLAAKTERQLGALAHQRGQWKEATSHYQKAQGLFAQSDDTSGQATACHEQARLLADRGDFAGADTLFKKALELFQQAHDCQGEARTRYSQALLNRLRGEFARAKADCEAVLPIFQAGQDQRMIAAVQHERGYLAFLRGEYDRAEELYKEAIALNRGLSAPLGIAIAQHDLGELYAEQRKWGPSRHMQEEAAQIFSQLGHRQGQAETSRELGRLDRLTGNLPSAERRCLEALALQETLQDPRGRAATLLEMAAIRQAQGRFEEALALIDEAQLLSKQAEDRLGQAHAFLRRAEVLAATEQLSDALAAGWEAWQQYTALEVTWASTAKHLLQNLQSRLGEAFALAWSEATGNTSRPEWLSDAQVEGK